MKNSEKLARELHSGVRDLTAMLDNPDVSQTMLLTAKLYMIRKKALMKAGFSEEEAMQVICKRGME